MLPISSDQFKKQIQAVENLILSEVNIKEIEYYPVGGDSPGTSIPKAIPFHAQKLAGRHIDQGLYAQRRISRYGRDRRKLI